MVRHDFENIIRQISKLNVNTGVTTNGVLLHKYFDALEECNVKNLNISIDSLDHEKFKYITKRDLFQTVWDNIKESIRRGFNVKLNMVVMRGFNDDEIPNSLLIPSLSDRVEVYRIYAIHRKFLGKAKVIPVAEMLDLVSQHFTFEKNNGSEK